MAPYPQIFDRRGVWASGHTLTLPALADPKKRDLAVEFLQWLVASPAWARSGQVPVYRGVDATPEFGAIPGGDVLLSMAGDQHMLPNTPRYNELFATNAPTPMMILAQEIILNRAPVLPTVEETCRTITAVLEVP